MEREQRASSCPLRKDRWDGEGDRASNRGRDLGWGTTEPTDRCPSAEGVISEAPKCILHKVSASSVGLNFFTVSMLVLLCGRRFLHRYSATSALCRTRDTERRFLHQLRFKIFTAFPPITACTESESPENVLATAFSFVRTLNHSFCPSSRGGKNGWSVPNINLSDPLACTAAFSPASPYTTASR